MDEYLLVLVLLTNNTKDFQVDSLGGGRRRDSRLALTFLVVVQRGLFCYGVCVALSYGGGVYLVLCRFEREREKKRRSLIDVLIDPVLCIIVKSINNSSLTPFALIILIGCNLRATFSLPVNSTQPLSSYRHQQKRNYTANNI